MAYNKTQNRDIKGSTDHSNTYNYKWSVYWAAPQFPKCYYPGPARKPSLDQTRQLPCRQNAKKQKQTRLRMPGRRSLVQAFVDSLTASGSRPLVKSSLMPSLSAPNIQETWISRFPQGHWSSWALTAAGLTTINASCCWFLIFLAMG